MPYRKYSPYQNIFVIYLVSNYSARQQVGNFRQFCQFLAIIFVQLKYRCQCQSFASESDETTIWWQSRDIFRSLDIIFKCKHSRINLHVNEDYIENRMKIIFLFENTGKTQSDTTKCVGVTKSCILMVIRLYLESGSDENCDRSNNKLD